MKIYRHQPKFKRIQRTWKETRKGIDRRTIRRFVIAVLAATAAACSPIQPDFACKTKPRLYWSQAIGYQYEIDHYTQSTPCPTVPID